MNLLTLPLVNPRQHIGKLKGFVYLLLEAFMRAHFDAYMKLLYPLCLVRRLFGHPLTGYIMVYMTREQLRVGKGERWLLLRLKTNRLLVGKSPIGPPRLIKTQQFYYPSKQADRVCKNHVKQENQPAVSPPGEPPLSFPMKLSHPSFLAWQKKKAHDHVKIEISPAILTSHGNPLSLVLSPKVSFRHQRQKNVLS